jgi:hypothetical protein
MTGKQICFSLAFVFLIALLVLLTVKVLPRAYQKTRDWRAESFAYQAEKAMGEGHPRLAHEKLQLAQRMSPKHPRVLRAMARYKFLQGDPRALALWIELVNRYRESGENWEGLFLSAMQAGNKKLAYRAIEGFKTAEPGNSKARQFECRLLVSDGRYDLAVFLAKQLVMEINQPKEVLLFAHEVLLSGTQEDRQTALAWLWKTTASEEMMGLSAAVVLARARDRSVAETDSLSSRLRTHPLSGFSHQLLAESLQLSGKAMSEEDRKQAWNDFGKQQKDADRHLLIRWLLNNKQADVAESLLGKKEVLSNSVAAQLNVDILGAGKRWEQLRDFLLLEEVPLAEFQRRLFLSRVCHELGDIKGSQLQWRLALAASGASPENLSAMANYAAVMHWDERAREVCTLLMENAATESLGLNGLLMLAYQRGNNAEVEALIQKMTARQYQATGF